MKEWLIRGLCIFLALTAGYYYVALRQSGAALQMLQMQINGQCQQVLERQGFTVEIPPPPVVEEEPEVKDDAER